jgi:hypothetical protein
LEKISIVDECLAMRRFTHGGSIVIVTTRRYARGHAATSQRGSKEKFWYGTCTQQKKNLRAIGVNTFTSRSNRSLT